MDFLSHEQYELAKFQVFKFHLHDVGSIHSHNFMARVACLHLKHFSLHLNDFHDYLDFIGFLQISKFI